MWKGPIEDGVTQSLLNKFLECPYSFYLYAILGLQDPEELNHNLIWGDCFHKGLELLIPTGDKKAAALGMLEYLHDRYPTAPESFQYSLPRMLRLYRVSPFEGDWITEQVIDTTIQINEYKVRIRGKRDAITTNHPQYGPVLGEHKCKGYTDPAQTREELQQDVQCTLYLLTNDTECEWVFYDLIKIPDTQKYGPAPQSGESSQDYIERIYSDGAIGSYGGKYPIYRYTSQWIDQGIYYFPVEDQEKVFNETIKPNILRLIQWYDYVTQPDFNHEDPKWFNEIFYKHPVRHFNGRRTEKFKCAYHGYLTGQQTLSDLVPVQSFYSELEDL